MARYVPDANVLIGWLLARQAPFDFIDRLATYDDIYAAQVLLPECTSTLRTAVFDGLLEPMEAQEMVGRLKSFPFRLVDSGQQFTRALDLADRFRHRRAYDMQYVAVAELLDAEIVTMDAGMRHAAETIGVPVRFLA